MPSQWSKIFGSSLYFQLDSPGCKAFLLRQHNRLLVHSISRHCHVTVDHCLNYFPFPQMFHREALAYAAALSDLIRETANVLRPTWCAISFTPKPSSALDSIRSIRGVLKYGLIASIDQITSVVEKLFTRSD